MPFTETQRVNIRHYLGYPEVSLAPNAALENAMDVVGELTEASAKVVSILAEIEAAQTALKPANASSLIKRAGVKKLGEIEFLGSEIRGNVAAAEMRTVGRNWVTELSTILNIPVLIDIFQAAYRPQPQLASDTPRGW